MSPVNVGESIPGLVVRPTEITLFRYSAVTWNPHRIHYDRDYAVTEGYPNVLVQGHLHGAWILSAVEEWLGDRGRVVRFSWQTATSPYPATSFHHQWGSGRGRRAHDHARPAGDQPGRRRLCARTRSCRTR